MKNAINSLETARNLRFSNEREVTALVPARLGRPCNGAFIATDMCAGQIFIPRTYTLGYTRIHPYE